MKNVFFSLILILGFNCNSFILKKGLFYSYEDNNEFTTITRDSIFEIHEQVSGLKSKYIINWKNKFVYTLRLKEIAIPGKKFKKVNENFNNKYISNKILSINKNYYIYRSTFYNSNKKESSYLDTIYINKIK